MHIGKKTWSIFYYAKGAEEILFVFLTLTEKISCLDGFFGTKILS